MPAFLYVYVDDAPSRDHDQDTMNRIPSSDKSLRSPVRVGFRPKPDLSSRRSSSGESRD